MMLQVVSTLCLQGLYNVSSVIVLSAKCMMATV